MPAVRVSAPGVASLAMMAIAKMMLFRVNRIVGEELIDWRREPDDPVLQFILSQEGIWKRQPQLGAENFILEAVYERRRNLQKCRAW